MEGAGVCAYLPAPLFMDCVVAFRFSGTETGARTDFAVVVCCVRSFAGAAGIVACGSAGIAGCMARAGCSVVVSVWVNGRLQTVQIPTPASPAARNHRKNRRLRRRSACSTFGQTNGGGGTSASRRRRFNRSSMLFIGRSIFNVLFWFVQGVRSLNFERLVNVAYLVQNFQLFAQPAPRFG